MPQEPTPRRPLEGHPSQMIPFYAFYAIVESQFAIKKTIVCIQKFMRRQIMIKHMPKNSLRLITHGYFKIITIVDLKLL